ncbi:hypothetical protein CFE70_003126 [Pyrenophora teres f. teres 0-1]
MESIISSLLGRKVVLLKANVRLPDIEPNQVEFVRVSEALGELVDELADGHPACHGPATAIEPSATSLAYVMLLLSSTGQPKGFMVEHRGIVRLNILLKLINAYGPTENPVTSTMCLMSRIEDCTNGVPLGDVLSNSSASFFSDSRLSSLPSILGSYRRKYNDDALPRQPRPGDAAPPEVHLTVTEYVVAQVLDSRIRRNLVDPHTGERGLLQYKVE